MATVHPQQRFVRGDTWPILITPKNADGSAFDFSDGVILEWKLRDASKTAVLSYSLAAGTIAIVTDGGVPKAYIEVPAGDSDDIAVGTYQDQFRATSPDGLVSTQVVGTIQVGESFFVPD